MISSKHKKITQLIVCKYHNVVKKSYNQVFTNKIMQQKMYSRQTINSPPIFFAAPMTQKRNLTTAKGIYFERFLMITITSFQNRAEMIYVCGGDCTHEGQFIVPVKRDVKFTSSLEGLFSI
ncbi:hypothetical protein O3G_MSEX009737 [Manduca sexta]|uniref:Uncharacterized protein n=1 Tax=Manduca sexta TaxID=7130 RepID=A0A921ZGB6_MANSE|nr:hypothetical protein O3G_MSEX009737 [Manduca sexta]